jgi:hypothetical protein
MPKITAPTKSFIILFILAVFLTFLCLQLWSDLPINPNNKASQLYYDETLKLPTKNQPEVIAPSVDTTAWKTYSSESFGFSFKYKPDWKVLPAKEKNGYTIIEVDPGAKFYNIKIYISKDDYYVMGGLPYKNETIGGQPSMNVNDLLFGVKYNNTYYTFDIGLSTSLKPNFDALVRSVTFVK